MANIIASTFLTQQGLRGLQEVARQRREHAEEQRKQKRKQEQEQKQERRARVKSEKIKKHTEPKNQTTETPSQFLSQAVPRVPLTLYEAAVAGRLDLIEKFIAAGADVNEKQKWGGSTPIMMAAANNHPDIVSALIKAEAQLDIKDDYGATVRNFAVWTRNAETLKLIDDALSAGKSPSTETSSVTRPVQSKPTP